MIEFKNINKTFHVDGKDVQALKNINLKINKGDIFGVIGYSGAGKSTLIRIINLLEKPDYGEIIVNNTKLNDVSTKQLREIRSNIGMIFQNFNLMNSIDVFNNIAAPLRNKKVPKDEIKSKVVSLLKLVGILDKAHAYPNQLSGGQKQRVAIARALSCNPDILLCDEATSALDPNTTKSILELLKKIHNELHITIVIITHQMEVVKNICNRVAIMEKGRIVEQGNIIDVFTSPKSTVAKEFVSQSVNSGIREENLDKFNGKIYKLNFFGDITNKPVLSNLEKEYGVQVNILFGNIENLYDSVVGSLIVEFLGKEENINKAVEYYKTLNTKVEVIRDVK